MHNPESAAHIIAIEQSFAPKGHLASPMDKRLCFRDKTKTLWEQ